MKTAEIRNLINQSFCSMSILGGCVLTDDQPRIDVFHMDPTDVFDMVHNHFMDVTGTPFNQVSGRVWLQSIFSDDRDRVCKEWYQSIIKNRFFNESYRIPDNALGGLKEITCSLVHKISECKQTIGYLGIFIDAAADSSFSCIPDTVTLRNAFGDTILSHSAGESHRSSVLNTSRGTYV